MKMKDFEKLGIQAISPFLRNGRWVFEQNGSIFDLAPAQLTSLALNPLVFGVDKLIQMGCNIKQIQPEDGFYLLFSSEYFPNADVKLIKKEQKADGWTYSIEAVNIKNVMTGQCVWICAYMLKFFKESPETIFVKIEEKNG